jgi:hypothetical protein
MSVMTGAAPRIRIDGPLPRPPRYTLSSVAQAVPDDAHWRAGGAVTGYPSDAPSGHDPCSAGTSRIKDGPSAPNYTGVFPAFTAYLGEACGTYGIGDYDEFRRRSEVALAARVSMALEQQLASASYVDAPHMGDDDVVLLATGAAVPVVTALGYLEDHLGASGQDGIIHVTPAVAAVLGDWLRDDRGVLRTGRGTPVAVGDGYIGADTPTSGGSKDTDAAAGQAWLYVTGPVLYRLDSEIVSLPETLAEALDRATNDVVFRAEQDLWVAWDKQVQGAVLADWSP